MFSQTDEETRATAGSGEEFDRFYASLADGLHALAQPLTILRSSVAAAGTEGIAPSRQRHYLDISIRQAERACAIFDSLQDLAIAGQSSAQRGPIDPKELL